MSEPITNAEATKLLAYAKRNREYAEEIRSKDPEGAIAWLTTAQDQERMAREHLDLKEIPKRGAGGELVTSGKITNLAQYKVREKPTAITVAASSQRLELLEGAGAADQALDLAQDSKPKSTRERQLLNAEASLSVWGQKLLGMAQGYGSELKSIDPLCKLVDKATRCFLAQVEISLAIEKIRSKGKQKVEVKHLHVHEGGQAIVGNVRTGSRKGRGDPQIGS
jgi:hypothetical protein